MDKYSLFEKQLGIFVFAFCCYGFMQSFSYWLIFDEFYLFVLAFAYLTQAFDIYLKMVDNNKIV